MLTYIDFCFSSWLDTLIWTGYRRELRQEDLYANPDHCRSQVLLKEFKKYVCSMYVCVCVQFYCVIHSYAGMHICAVCTVEPL